MGIECTERSIPAAARSTRLPLTPDEHRFRGPWPGDGFFGRRAPLEVELGTGKARFLIESARRHPERDYLGLERSLAYYRVARDRIARADLPNVRVLRADAGATVALMPPGVSAFHAYFLDPWPKKKQRKRRLIDARFLALLFEKTAPGGLLRIVTDHADYARSIREAAGACAALGARWEERAWDSEEAPPPTHYELKYAASGRPIYRLLLRARP